HGKVVLLDNLINNTDYGLGITSDKHRMLALYGDGGDVRVGSGRDNTTRDGPPGWLHNTTFVDSTENTFNYRPPLLPVTPRDVVWIVNSGKGSTEVAFDDYLNPDGFIVSEMAGSLTFAGSPVAGRFDYHDGFGASGPTSGAGFSRAVRLENAATAVPERWRVPAYGRVVGGARLEPIAQGGIHG